MDTSTVIIKAVQQFARLKKQVFYDQMLGSYQWWLLLGMAVISWIVWLIVVDRSRLRSISLTGLFAAMFTTIMDDVGVSLALWAYPYQLVYFTTWLSPVNFATVPVVFMIIYQYFRTWKSYILVVILFAALSAFVAEPIFNKMHIAVVLHWRYIYSLPMYVAIGIVSKWLADWFTQPIGKSNG